MQYKYIKKKLSALIMAVLLSACIPAGAMAAEITGTGQETDGTASDAGSQADDDLNWEEEDDNSYLLDEEDVQDENVHVDASRYSIPDNGSNNPVVYFPQGNAGGYTPEWRNLSYSQGCIGTSGCSITALAMVLSYLRSGTDSSGWVYPSDVRATIAEHNDGNYNKFMASSGGAYHGKEATDIIINVAGYYGYRCSMISDYSRGHCAEPSDIRSIKKALNAGYPVIAVAHSGHFTNNGHFIVITGLSDGLYTVNDPSHPNYSYDHYTEEELFSSSFNLNGWWVIYK